MEIIESIVITDTDIPALSYRVDILPDYDTYPEDFDCYDESQIAAWRNDEWRYVGVVVTPIVGGFELPLAEASLWGVEYGTSAASAEMLAREYPGPDLIAEARGYLVKTLGSIVVGLVQGETSKLR
jgi:hypothetical protein